jgi:MFS family permease
MTNEEISTARPVRARLAVNVLFFVNGALISNVLPRLPALKADLGLSNSQLGVAVASAAFGALLAGPLAGRATARVGSARLGVGTAVVYGAALPLVGVAGSWAALACTFGFLGVLDVLMDVAMNAHGLHVQSRYHRSIFNVFHAWWSIGATAGGAVGAAAAALAVPVALHLLVAGVVLAAATLVSARWLLPGRESELLDLDDEAPGAAEGAKVLRLLRTLAPFAAFSIAAAFVEDVPGSFGAVYMRDWLGASPGVAGLVWVGFMSGMTLGRLRADLLVDRYGARVVLRCGNALAAVALGVALLVGHPVAAIIGFTGVGLGACSTIPSLFVLAGNRARRPSDGIALVSWATRFGFLASPVVVGLVADAAGLPLGVALGAVAAAGIALTASPRMRSLNPPRDS